MKQLKDYLHLYLGCEVVWKHDKSKFWLIGIDGDRCRLRTRSGASIHPIELEDVTIVLRPLSDMTDGEEHEAYSIRGKNSFNEFEGETVKYLLSKHLDLFNLIPEGLAIDKTTLK